jgi:hypothetical protein
MDSEDNKPRKGKKTSSPPKKGAGGGSPESLKCKYFILFLPCYIEVESFKNLKSRSKLKKLREEGDESENTEKGGAQQYPDDSESPTKSKAPKVRGTGNGSDEASPNKPPRNKKKKQEAAGGALSQDF